MTAVEIAGGPTSLNPAGTPLLVSGGEATLFLVMTSGRRRPVITFAAPALIATDPAPVGQTWFVGAGLQSEVAAADTAAGLAPETRAAVTSTVAALGHALGRAAPPPGVAVVRLGVGPAHVSAEGGAMVDAAAWALPVEGELTLAGHTIPAAGFPLPAKLHLGGGRFTVAAARPFDEIDDAALVAGLRWLTSLAAILAVEEADRRDQRDAEHAAGAEPAARVAESVAVRLLADEATAATAASALSPARVALGGDPLLSCARMVGAAAAIELSGPEGGLRAREGADAVRAVASASQVFARRVALTGEWWCRPEEPILGWRTDGTPVALVPRNGAMQLVEADGRSGGPVDATVAKGLVDVGFVFARPLDEPNVTARLLVRRALRNRGPELRRWFLWVVLLATVSLSVPLASGVVFGEIIPQTDRHRLGWLLGVLLFVALASVPLSLALTAARVRLEAAAAYEVQRSIWGRVLRSPVSIVDRFGAGDLVMRIWALEAARDPFEQAVLGAAPALVAGLVASLLLLRSSPKLAVLVVLVGLMLLVNAIRLGRQAAEQQKAVDLATGQVHNFLLQVLLAIPKLHVAAAESRAFLAWADRFRGAVGRRLLEVTGRMTMFTGAVQPLGMLSLYTGVMLTDPTHLGVGVFMAFQTTYSTFLGGIGSLSSATATALQLRPAIQRAVELAEVGTEISAGRMDPGQLTGAVSLVDVTFRYLPGTRPVLDGLSLRIEPSEMVAIVGASGCGKSTLLRLLLGFAEPEAGSVFYDESDLSFLDVAAVRRQIGVVLQDGQLLPGTIHQNLAGVSNLSTDEIWELAEAVALADDLRALPMKLDTPISMASGSFSGGQRQRLLIARALATKPRILLLDEATSALDNVTQKIVTDNLARLGMTRIVVAHRLSTLVDADRIIVLDRGKVAEQGTYPELMAARGAFHALAARQLL